MNFQLITLLGVKVDQDVYEVIIPTAQGEIAVFPGHEALVTLAVPGVISVRRHKDNADSQLELLAISGGVAEISQTQVRMLVDEAEHADDIVEAESQAALERALKLQSEAKDQVELEKAHQLVDRQKVRLRVAELRRRRHQR